MIRSAWTTLADDVPLQYGLLDKEEFALDGLLVAGIARLSVAYQCVNAAPANPAESLRSE